MDKKIELHVVNITNSQVQAGAFAMVLGEVDGKRQLPIIIGPAEAQSTALFLKGIKTPRPLTHQLFMTTLEHLDVQINKILIYKAEEGIFFSLIYLKKGEETIRIDSRTSDAIALAVRAACPILIYESILERECLRISEESEMHEKSLNPHAPTDATEISQSLSLEDELKQAIKEENYELAAQIRDKIKQRKE